MAYAESGNNRKVKTIYAIYWFQWTKSKLNRDFYGEDLNCHNRMF